LDTRPPHSIRIMRHFVEPPVKLWQAWTDPQRVRLWFGSDPNGTVIQTQLDVQVGGKFEVTFANADRTTYTCYGTYREVEPNTKLIFSWSWKNTPDVEELVSVSLQADGSGTLMTFVHANIDPDTSHAYETGWSTTFEKLEKVLKG
jgi:uncharacterized protein YndB with AHSA1/START domain